jgi:SOS-response transcriptional repressor LexA
VILQSETAAIRQQKLATFIREYWLAHGYGCSFPELMAACGLRGKAGVIYALDALIAEGVITATWVNDRMVTHSIIPADWRMLLS